MCPFEIDRRRALLYTDFDSSPKTQSNGDNILLNIIPSNEEDIENITDQVGSESEISTDTDQVVASERAGSLMQAIGLSEVLAAMGKTYRENPVAAVRGQSFITQLHQYIGTQLQARLTQFAVHRGISVYFADKAATIHGSKPKKEATILGSTKPKNVDVTVVDPENGPLVLIGVRSQMSSVGKNVLTYYEEIVGGCSSLQERFPMSTHGYVYLHPVTSIKEGKEKESIDHARYAKMYAAVTGRTGPSYKSLRGIFDEFAYMVVDFTSDPLHLDDALVRSAVQDLDLSITTFIDRIVKTFNSRTLFWDVFK